MPDPPKKSKKSHAVQTLQTRRVTRNDSSYAKRHTQLFARGSSHAKRQAGTWKPVARRSLSSARACSAVVAPYARSVPDIA
eukprot:2905004-Rhodomonas_salina.1